SAEAVLAKAMQALGSPAELSRCRGFSGRGILRGGDLEVPFQAWFRRPDQWRQTCKVLATTIETVVHGKEAEERCGDQVLSLPSSIALELGARALRHPVILLGEHVRDPQEFRVAGME